MAIRRGILYEFTIVPGASGFLVLTNDQWTAARSLDVSGALVYKDPGAGRLRIPDTDAFAGELLQIPKDRLVTPLAQLDADHLLPIEESLCDLLALRELHRSPPKQPASVPGAIDYPQWSQIYYASPPEGEPPQNKRRIVVSVDGYNKATRGAVCVRTTTSPNREGPGFPVLADGTKAVCILPTFFSERLIRFKPRDGRPVPSQLFAADMALVAEGLVDALDLHHLI